MQVTTSFLLPLSTSLPHSLRCRRLEVVDTRKNGRARSRHATPLACLRRAPVLSFAHYFQAPATQPPSHRDVLGASWRVLAPSTFVQQT